MTGTRPTEAGPGEELSETWRWFDEDISELIAQESERFDGSDEVTVYSVSSPVVKDGTLVVEVEFSLEGHRALVALESETGQPIWIRVFGPEARGWTYLTPALAEDRVVHLIPDGEAANLLVLDLETGDDGWNTGIHYGALVVRDKTVYVVGTDAISAYDLDGEREWKETDPGITRPSGTLTSLTSQRATVTASSILAMDGIDAVSFDREGGDEVWRAEIADPRWQEEDGNYSPFTAPMIADGRAFAGRSILLSSLRRRAELVSYDADDGDVHWRFPEPPSSSGDGPDARGAVNGYPVVADGRVFATVWGSDVTSEAGADPDQNHLFAFDVDSGDVEWTAPAQNSFAPVVAGDVVYVHGWDKLFVLSTDGEQLDSATLDDHRFHFHRSPALAEGRLYAPVSRGGIIAYGE